MTRAQIAEGLAICANATMGPWVDAYPDNDDAGSWVAQDNGEPFQPYITGIDYDGRTRREDVQFIAYARTALPKALAALERVYKLSFDPYERHSADGIKEAILDALEGPE